MSDDALSVESSLFWARQNKAHREQIHHYQLLHRRQSPASSSSSIDVTEVTQTVSIIQEIVVDRQGNTVAIQTYLASDTTTPSTALATTTGTIPQSLLSNSSTISSTALTSGSFSSLIVTSNSTLISSSSSSTSSNSTSLLTTSSSSSSTTSSSTSTTFSSSTSSSSTSFSTSSNSSFSSSTTGFGGIIGGTETAAGIPSSTAGTDGLNSDSGPPSTPVVVGSVVGAVAGAALILLILLFVFRHWKKRHGAALEGTREAPIGPAPEEKPERKSVAFAVPAALANLTGYKRSSQKTETDPTVSSTGSEIGFVRVSGRKLPSALQTGGDGYGGDHLSGTSFYRDSTGFHGGLGSPSSPPGDMTIQRDSGIPLSRPSPARTPIIEHGPFADVPLPPPSPRRPDALGRSHSSQDGSHASKFTEEV